MRSYIIKHYWDIESKSATLEPKWLSNNTQNLTKEQQEIKELYKQTIGNARRYEDLSTNEIAEEIIDNYCIHYIYRHKLDPLAKDKSKARRVTDIEMRISKCKKPINYILIISTGIVLLGIGIYLYLDNPQSLGEKHKSHTIFNIVKKDKKLEICLNGNPLYVKEPSKKGLEQCWQRYIYDKCQHKTTDSFQKYWNTIQESDCTFEDTNEYLKDLFKSKQVPYEKYIKFFNNEVSTDKKISKKLSYDKLVSDWNKAVRNVDLNKSFTLSNQYNKDFFNKLNNILNQTQNYKDFSKQNQCVLNSDKKIFIPSKQYAKFLEQSSLAYKVNFDTNNTEEDIIAELKKITHTKYISADMLKKIKYLHSFKLFFEDNKKKFYKQGFSKYIKSYEKYLESVKKCKIKDKDNQ